MPEVYLPLFKTTLTAAIVSTSRPITFTVAASQAALAVGNATFSVLIFDVGTDNAPTHAEAFKITAGGAGLSWTGTNEAEWTPTTHANGSSVYVTILTPRSIQQPLTNHTDPLVIADPHSIYIKGSGFTAKGDSIIGTGAGTYQPEAVGVNNTVLIADSSQPTGRRWGNINTTAALSFITHMGDLVVGGLLGVAQRFGIGNPNQILAVVQNTPLISDPTVGPVCSATGSGGSLINTIIYDFAFAWATPNPTPDGGTTNISPITSFAATTTGVVSVQCPPSPLLGATLLVYGAQHGVPISLQTSVANASTVTTNTVIISSLISGPTFALTNTTGGLGLNWVPTPAAGTVGPIGPPGPSGLSATTILGTPPYFSVVDQEISGTPGGTFAAGAWQQRTLNTILANDSAIAGSLLNNNITLNPGTYRTLTTVPAYRVLRNAARLQNITTGVTLLPGSSEFAFDSGATGGTTRSIITGRFTISQVSVIQVQHQCQQTISTNGFGIESGSSFTVSDEVYTTSDFWLEGGAPPFIAITFANPSFISINLGRYSSLSAQAIPVSRALIAAPFFSKAFENPNLDRTMARYRIANISGGSESNTTLPV